MPVSLTRREITIRTLVGAAGLALPDSKALAQNLVSTRVDYSLVDPQLQAAARGLVPITEAFSSLSAATLAGVRAASGKSPNFDPEVPVDRRVIPGNQGAGPVVVYVVNARSGTRRPAILHMHGGGFVMGTAADNIVRLQNLARTLDCVIVSVDYRLAPEVGYLGSTEDNYAGLRWLFGNAAGLGVDTARIAVMGESAGGGHAALLAIAARDRGEFKLAYQLLVYPMLDDRTGSSRPASPVLGQIIWTPAANRFGWRSFLGQEPGTASVPAAAVPARVRDVSGLPPACICVGALDLFAPENLDYARRLVEAGVPTELLMVPGAFHSFDALPVEATVIKRFNEAKTNALRKGLAITGS